MKIRPQRLLRLGQVNNITAVWGCDGPVRIRAEDGVVGRGNDHIHPDGTKILHDAVQKRLFLLDAEFLPKGNSLHAETDEAKKGLADYRIRQHAAQLAVPAAAANPSVFIAHR